MIIHSYKILVLAVALYVFATATAAHADGTHGCQTTITNSYSGTIKVLTYNSNDQVCIIGHKKYTIKSGETKTVKAHSQGQSHCKMEIYKNGKRMCLNQECGPRVKFITRTSGKKTSVEVKGRRNCPGLKGTLRTD